MNGALDELLARRLPMHLDLLLRSQHQPAFLDARAGVGAQFGAIVFVAAHADLEHQFGGTRVCVCVIVLTSANDGKIRLRLRIAASEGLFLPDETARWLEPLQQAQQALAEEAVQGGLGHFVIDGAVEQLGFLRDEAEVAQRMIGLDAQRPDLRAGSNWLGCFGCRHVANLVLRGGGVQLLCCLDPDSQPASALRRKPRFICHCRDRTL